MLEIAADGKPLHENIYKIQKLARLHLDFFPLQDLLARTYLNDLGQPDEAAEIAQQAMRAFPGEVEPAWIAAEALAKANRWNEALEVAQEWRRRAAIQPLDADMM